MPMSRSEAKRTRRFPALAAGEADAEGGRPAERAAAANAGLRREEVAELAGIGVDWYIRLEQGRTVSPSVTTIDALARALRLGKAEHKHLRALTQNTDRRAFVRETVPPAVRRTVERLNLPAYVTGRRWDILAWNAAADEIFALQPAAGRRSQHSAQRADQPRDAAAVRRVMGGGGAAHGGAIPRDA